MFCQYNWETSYIFHFQYQPQVSPIFLYVRCKFGVTFIRRSFRDECLVMSLNVTLKWNFISETSQKGYRYHKLRKTFSKFYPDVTMTCYQNLIRDGLKSLLKQNLSEPEFYSDLVYKFNSLISLLLRKLLVEMIFLINLGKLSFVTKESDTTWMLCDRLHAWWLTQLRLTTLQTSLIARRWVGPQT